MKKLRMIISAALAVAFLGAFSLPTAAVYADNGIAYVGAGSGIQFGSRALASDNPAVLPEAGVRICTLSAIGYDQYNNLVGISVGHCPVITSLGYDPTVANAQQQFTPDSTWAQVYGQGDPDAGQIGTVVKSVYEGTKLSNSANKDYSVIQFDKTKVVPLQTVGSTTVSSLSTTNPAWFSNVCKEGRTTAQTCGIVNSVSTSYFQTLATGIGGDSGAPVVGATNGKLYGYLQGSVGQVPFTSPSVIVSLQPTLTAINTAGGVGSGFHL